MSRALLLNNKEFFYDQIAKGDIDHNLLTDFEKNTLNFCREWLNGSEEFELKTSGSTGVPKNIIVSRRQMEESSRLTTKKLGLVPGDTSFICLDTAYIGGKMMLVRSFEQKMNMVIVSPSSDPFADMDEKHFDFTALIPMQMQKILQNKPEKIGILNRMKAIIVGGGVINHHLANAIQQVKAPVYATYGMTETVSHIALRKINTPDKMDYFEAFKELKIDQDERGCLTVSGELTNNEVIKTNDLVEIIDKKRFRWLGRIDNVINSGGVKVHVEQLEDRIERLNMNILNGRRFIIVGMKDDLLGERVTLLVEGKPFQKNDESLLLTELNRVVPAYHHPKAVFYLPEFKETDTGKVNRNKTFAALTKFLN